MRTAIISPYAHDVPGGVNNQVFGLARALEQLEVTVTVITPRAHISPDIGRIAGDPLQPRHTFATVEVGRTIAFPVNGSRASIAPYPAAMTRTVRTLRAFAPDVIHIHEPFVPGPSLAALMTHIAPIVGTFHRGGSDALYRAMRPALRPLMRRIDDAVAVSGVARETISDVLGSLERPCAIIENAVDVDAFAHAAPWPTQQFTYVFVGRHEPRKGLRVLLEAFSGIESDDALWIIGEGPQTAELQAKFGHDSRLQWCGRVESDELARRIRGADIFVTPALSGESFGVVLLEAMAAHTAVIASDLPGYRLAGAEHVEYVSPGDVGALRDRLIRLRSDVARRTALAAAGAQYASNQGFSRQAARYLDRYQRLVSQ